MVGIKGKEEHWVKCNFLAKAAQKHFTVFSLFDCFADRIKFHGKLHSL